MRNYSPVISLVRNDRGVYCLDTTMGCGAGLLENPKGCYGDCYAFRISKIYGYDFKTTVLRGFESVAHKNAIVRAVRKVNLPFVRVGCSGDPSENWGHTINILEQITRDLKTVQFDLFNNAESKQVVLITRHWKCLTDSELQRLSNCGNICVNTSVSAIDTPELMERSLREYNRLKPFVKSVLRVVSFDFNTENERGQRCAKIQEWLFKNEMVIDTVFRASPKNPLVTDGVIKIKKSKFLGKNSYISKYNKKTYMGKCDNCKEMCGSKM